MITCGAEPLILLDYVAAAQIELEEVAELVEGAAEVCRDGGRRARSAARRPSCRASTATASSTSPGPASASSTEPLDGSAIEAGDVVIGFPSAGVHANGFTLVRRVLEEEDYDGPDLLAPTRLYLDVARSLRGRALAFAHVTGGGILGNLERVLPAGRSAEIDWYAWERPPVFNWLARHVEEDELRRVFNLGIGWCAVVRNAEPGDLVIGRIA